MELTRLKRQRKRNTEGLAFLVKYGKALMNQSTAPAIISKFRKFNASNIPEKIDEVIAEPLYGKDIYTSVSRMESFIGVNINTFLAMAYVWKKEMSLGFLASSYRNFSMKHWISSLNYWLWINGTIWINWSGSVNLLAEEVLNSILGMRVFCINDL